MNHTEPTPELLADLEKWLDANSEVRELAERFPFYKLYYLKTANQRVYPIGYSENGTLRVVVLEKFNPGIAFEREVFGILPENLEEIE